MFKEVEEIKYKKAQERRKYNRFVSEQFLKAFFEIYTPEFIKDRMIKDALENKTTFFTFHYEFDGKSIEDHEGFTIDKIDDRYVIKCSNQLRGIIEGYSIKKTKIYKQVRKYFKKHEFRFIFNETDSPWNEYNTSGKYKGTIELEFYKDYKDDPQKWLERFY